MIEYLAVGESRTFSVDSRQKTNRAGFVVAAGQSFRFRATGGWKDWFIPSDADGYLRWLFWPVTRRRRLPAERWFALCGEVIGNNQPFLIGRAADVSMPADGELSCFANDLPSMYGNNRGTISVTATRLS